MFLPINEEEYFQKAKVKCGQFLTSKSWSDPDNIDTSVLSGGFINVMVLCKLIKADPKQDSFDKVLVRFLTGHNPFGMLGEAAQAILYQEVYEKANGPKLFGVFEGGRLEEFLEARNPTAQEFRDPEVLKALAESLARLHSLDSPLQEWPCFGENMEEKLIEMDKAVRESEAILNVDTIRPGVADKIRAIIDFNSVEEFKWFQSQLGNLKSRKVKFCHGDHFQNNVLVAKKGDQWTAYNIDIEMCSFYHRGLDIGMLLNETEYDYTSTAVPVHIGPLADELYNHFLKCYLDAWTQLNPNKVDPAVDNVTNLRIEARFFALIPLYYAPIFFLYQFTQSPENFPEPMMDCLIDRHKAEIALKQEFLQRLARQ